jgi:hypothetical protein
MVARIKLIQYDISQEVVNCRIYTFKTVRYKWVFYYYLDKHVEARVQIDELLHKLTTVNYLERVRNLLIGRALVDFDDEFRELGKLFKP